MTQKHSSLFLSILRIVGGILFWQHGAQKVFGWLGAEAASAPSPLWMLGVLQLTASVLIIVGLLTRPVALVLLIEMAVVYIVQFMPRGAWPINNGGELSLQYLLVFLVLLVVGPGTIAADKVFSRCGSALRSLNRFTPSTLTLLRLATGFLFWQHGAGKFGMLDGRVREFPELQFFAGILEFFGGLLIFFGIWTRPVAFILSGEMAVAFWRSRLPLDGNFWPIEDSNEKAVLFCFVFLYMMATGQSKWSIDWLYSRKSKKRALSRA